MADGIEGAWADGLLTSVTTFGGAPNATIGHERGPRQHDRKFDLLPGQPAAEDRVQVEPADQQKEYGKHASDERGVRFAGLMFVPGDPDQHR